MDMRKHPGKILLKTGELDDGNLIRERRKEHCQFKEYLIVNQRYYAELANSPITLQARRVLDLLLSVMGFENEVQIRNQAEAAKLLNMSAPAFSRALRQLREAGLIEHDKLRLTYRIPPEHLWRGKNRNHKAALRRPATPRAPTLTLIQGSTQAPQQP